MWTFLLALLLAWVLVAAVLAWFFRSELRDLWREPVLRGPVLIIESDDWGAGPSSQTTSLQHLHQLLDGFRDHRDHPPVMTLGVVLAVADTKSIVQAGLSEYHRLTLGDPAHAPVRQAMLDGADAGVFALQLHGMEHYRPASLLKAARDDSDVAAWLGGPERRVTELLPSPLQSRWTDASVLPSQELAAEEVAYLVTEETSTFANVFGRPARVVVPPTFQWTEPVERAWARAGIATLISPGGRQVARDADGELVADGSRQLNGEQGGSGLNYLVRDAWFEPAMGHKAAKGLAALAERTTLGRPTLLETHRFNFLGDVEPASLAELKALFEQAQARYPRLRFVSSEELGRALSGRDPEWVETQWSKRIAAFLQRLARVPRLGRLARVGVFVIPLGLAQRLFPRPA